MQITFTPGRKLFRILLHGMEYAFAVNSHGELISLHWGAPMNSDDDYELLMPDLNTTWRTRGCNSGEYRFGAPFDYAAPAIRVRFPDGSETLRLEYRSHEITSDSLIITLSDSFYKLDVKLIYRTYGDLPLISRHAVIENHTDGKVILRSAMSATLELPLGEDYRLTHFAGEWGAEYQPHRQMVGQGGISLETSYLTNAASHIMPFFALDAGGRSTETFGEVYFGALMYSGDFRIFSETMHTQIMKRTSLTLGVNDRTAEIPLEPGESFETPAAIAGFSDRGFEKMSEILYDWQFDHILPRGTNDKAHTIRPVIYNTWYPYEFSIDEQKLIDFIPKAKYIGAELYVIDDGWMKGRTDDKHGLGDWVIDPVRFPRGLGYIADKVHEAGLMFGLWVEPEMVNPDSDLYRAHPDWVLSEPNRDRTLSRTQCVLDMSRDDITDWAIDWLDKLIIDAKLDYLKWDMNREQTEIGPDSLERGVAVKYMKNIERIWKHLNERFPDLLLENCASGGGRADYGMLPYADRVNRSDNADPIDVMLLHEGYSTLFVPKLAGGAGNVSPSPNHVNKRSAPLDFRVNSGMTGSMSVGVNLLKCDDDELDRLRDAVDRLKALRPGLQDAYVYRLASAHEHPYSVLQYVKRDKSEFTLFAFGHGMRQWDKQSLRFRMRGLAPDKLYVSESGVTVSGAALMNGGITLGMYGDYYSHVETWKAMN